ncbi:BQ2448_13 [Microbotryum intermedium]|uniref:BQ2448_13 protein n=1 Tax=Microbotryum intermedium TaxID=269621 RepID=A0A238FIA2_9BASI|nr:BQ2448_13 [Microbotryum intermedium]
MVELRLLRRGRPRSLPSLHHRRRRRRQLPAPVSSHHDSKDSRPSTSFDYPERTSSHYQLATSPSPTPDTPANAGTAVVMTTTTTTAKTTSNGPLHQQFGSRRSTSTSTAPVALYTTGPKESSRTKMINKIIHQITLHLPSHSTSRHRTGYPSVGQRATREATKGLEGACRNPGAIEEVLSGLLRELERPGSSERGEGARNMSSVASAPLLSSLDVLRSHRELLRITSSCLLVHWWSHIQRSSTPTEPTLDPPALDEILARSLLNVVVPRKSYVPSSISVFSTSPSYTSDLVLRVFRSLEATPTRHVADLIDSPFSSSETREDLRFDIHHYSALVLYFLSASNWPLIHDLLRQRLTGHYGTGAPPNEVPSSNGTAMDLEAHDLRILESCCFSRSRLSSVFQDVFNAFLHLRKPARLVLVHTLRLSVWSWITSRPAEYRAMVQSGRRLEGGCDMLFDLLWAQSAILVPEPLSSAPSTSTPTATSQNLTRRMSPTPSSLWSTMMMLLLCCPDIVQQLTNHEDAAATNKPAGGYSKKKQFLDGIKAALSDPVGGYSDHIWHTCVDLLMASHQIVDPSSSIGPLRVIAPRASRRIIEESDLIKLLGSLMEPASPFSQQLGAVNALLILFSDPISPRSCSSISKSLGILFSHATRLPRPIRRARQGSAGSLHTDSSTAVEDASPDLIRSILVLWSNAPHFLVNDAGKTLVAVAEMARDLLDETIDRLAFGMILAAFQSYEGRPGPGDDAVDWSLLGKIIAHRILEADDATMAHCLLLRVLLEIIKRPPWKKAASAGKWSEAFWNALEASLLVSALSPSDEISELALECAHQILVVHGAASPIPYDRQTPRTGEGHCVQARYATFSQTLHSRSDPESERPGGTHLLHHKSPTPHEATSNMGRIARNQSLVVIDGLVESSTRDWLDATIARDRPTPLSTSCWSRSSSTIQLFERTRRNYWPNNLDIRQLGAFVMELKKSAQRLLATDHPESKSANPVFTNMLFVAQSLMILQALVARVDAGALHREVYNPMIELLVLLAELITALPIQDERLRLQNKLSALCEHVHAKSVELDETSASKRTKVLEYLYRWVAVSEDRAGQRAFSSLLRGLKLQTHDGSPDRALFNRYFDHFTRVLSDMADRPELDPRIAADVTRTRSSLMEGFAALLSSNQELAAQRIPEMTCSGLQETLRHIYLEVLTLLLNRGVKFDSDDGSTSTESAYNQIFQLIRHNPSSLALALCEVCPPAKYDDLIEVLLRVMSSPSATVSFLRAVIAAEVSATDHESTLFRGNTLASRLLTIYSKVQGYHYLRETLRDLLLTICSKPPEFNLDFDPHRDSSEDDVASRNLIQVTEAFLVRIAQSANPASPNPSLPLLGASIFLRFINPAIVSPEMIDLDLVNQTAGNDTREVRKALVSVSKILQALATMSASGPRSPG